MIKKSKIEIIQETVKYYSEDVNRRAMNYKTGICYYLTKEGKMCAIGRCLTEDGLNLYKKNDEVFVMEMFPFLKEEYNIDDLHFWRSLQSLHDKNWYWNKEGLSESGKDYYNFLLNKYKDVDV